MFKLLNSNRVIKDTKNIFFLKKLNKKYFIIIGPCSLSNIKDIIQYINKLKKINFDKVNIIVRVYYEKPRTTIGWKGYIYDPYQDNSYCVYDSIYMIRILFLDVLKKQINIGIECLNTLFYNYFSDCISWVCIGARTVLSQIHREFCSNLNCIVAIKNEISGNLKSLNEAFISINSSQIFLHYNNSLKIIKSKGVNKVQFVLRGGTKPNFSNLNLEKYIIDCSHMNSYKEAKNQIYVFENIFNQIFYCKKNIIGFMLESNLNFGNQKKDILKGISVTDSCLNFKFTKIIIEKFIKKL